MAISFELVPLLRTPGVFAEFSAIRAQQGLSIQNYKVLLIGQRVAVQARATGTLVLAGQPANGDQYVISDGVTPVTFEFDSGAIAASGTLVLAGQPADGDQYIIDDGTTAVTFEFDSDASVVNGPALRGVTIGAAVADTLANLLAAINAAPNFQIAAGAVTGGDTVPLTADIAGAAGNVVTLISVNVSGNLSATGMAGGADGVAETDQLRAVTIAGSTALTLANLLAEINSAPDFGVTAISVTGGTTVNLRNDLAGTDGNVAILEAVNASGNLSDTGMAGGAYTPSGSGETLVPYRIGSAQVAANLWGAGSHLHRAALSFFKNNSFTEVWGIALEDAVAGTPATATFTITGPATAAGTLVVYAGGTRYAIEVAAADTATIIAANLAAAVTADTTAPFTAAAVAGVVTFTAKNGGLVGNSLDLRHSHNSGEVLPTGVGATVVGFFGGGGSVNLQDAFDAIGEEWFNVIVSPYTGNANMAAFQAELESRWGPLRAVEAYGFVSAIGDVADVIATAALVNSGHMSVIPAQGSPTWTVEIAAAAAATVAFHASIDPARPFNGLPLVGVVVPQVVDRWTLSERNSLLFEGVATTRIDDAGQVVLERVVSTYRTNSIGAEDGAFLDSNTHFTNSYLRYDLVTFIRARYPRSKLAGDNIRLAAGQAIVTPGMMKAEVVARAGLWESLGLVENLEEFKTNLICERDTVDPTRLNVQLAPDLVNPLIVVAARITFIL